MFGESHDIPHEFPQYKEMIAALQEEDVEFKKMYQEYHRLDNEIRSIEQNVETVSDVYAEGLKKKRVYLKDCIYQRLKENSHMANA